MKSIIKSAAKALAAYLSSVGRKEVLAGSGLQGFVGVAPTTPLSKGDYLLMQALEEGACITLPTREAWELKFFLLSSDQSEVRCRQWKTLRRALCPWGPEMGPGWQEPGVLVAAKTAATITTSARELAELAGISVPRAETAINIAAWIAAHY